MRVESLQQAVQTERWKVFIIWTFGESLCCLSEQRGHHRDTWFYLPVSMGQIFQSYCTLIVLTLWYIGALWVAGGWLLWWGGQGWSLKRWHLSWMRKTRTSLEGKVLGTETRSASSCSSYSVSTWHILSASHGARLLRSPVPCHHSGIPKWPHIVGPDPWVWSLVLPRKCSVTLGKLLHLSEPRFS